MVSMGTPKAKETDHEDHPDGSLLEVKVKTECEKSKDSMEMLAYFNKLPEKTREEILSQLRLQGDPHASTASESQTKKNLGEYMSEMDNASNAYKSRLYDEFIETQCKNAGAKRYGGKIPSHQLQSGLQITLVSCKDNNLGEVKVFFAKKIMALIRSLTRRQETR